MRLGGGARPRGGDVQRARDRVLTADGACDVPRLLVSQSYADLQKRLNLDADQLLAYVWLDAVQEGMEGSTVRLQVPASIQAYNS